jgi:hypothetical protein
LILLKRALRFDDPVKANFSAFIPY